MSTTPRTEKEWLALVRGAMPPLWRLIAERSAGGSFWQRRTVGAAIVPATAERSVFNSAFYEDSEELAEALPALADAYDDAGVRAWTVWVPAADEPAKQLLLEAGHVLDAEPLAMAMELSELRDFGQSEAEIVEEYDLPALARINEMAYGYSDGSFTAALAKPLPDTRIYLARLNDRAVAAGMMWDHGEDTEATFIATLAEARGRGIAGHLLGQALREAAVRGLKTTTLQATKAGRSIYDRLGYRNVGVLEMWERRRDS